MELKVENMKTLAVNYFLRESCLVYARQNFCDIMKQNHLLTRVVLQNAWSDEITK